MAIKKQKKLEYLQIRLDPELKQAIRIFCRENYLDESSAARMAVAQFPPIKEIIERLQAESTDEKE